MIYIVKGFSVVDEAEIDVFLEFSCFFYNAMVIGWSLVTLPFLNPVCTSGSSLFTYCWRLTWRILSITLLAFEMSATVQYCLSLGLERQLTFSHPVATAEFSKFAGILSVALSLLVGTGIRLLTSEPFGDYMVVGGKMILCKKKKKSVTIYKSLNCIR